MRHLIVIADLGRVRAVKFRPAGDDPIEQEHLFEDETKGAVEHVATRRETVTDQSGRFGRDDRAGKPSAAGYGEEHNEVSEMERKGLERIAARIDGIVEDEGYPQWILAAPQPILERLQMAISKTCRECLSKTVGADLGKEPIAKLERRFGLGRKAG